MPKPTSVSFLLALALVAGGLSGCTLVFQKGRRSDVEKMARLQQEYNDLQNQLTEMERAKAELENRLRQEIDDRQVKVEMMDRGLVITFVAEVLFDSGKAKLRPDALEKLAKVARVLNTTVEDLNVGVEGHTDNVPIKYSKWKSNWELSTARALSVLHYLVEDLGVSPRRVSATGYGEFHPVASNDTPEGRQKNRRVEIVILPRVAKKASAPVVVETENLK